MDASRRRLISASVVGVIVASLLSGCLWDIERRVQDGLIDQTTNAAFYTMPASLPAGNPGDIIKKERIASAPLGSQAWRVIYHSRDMAGTDVAVSALIIEPDIPAPAGGRTVVSWAHPTTGSAARCAPSLQLDPFELIEGLEELLVAGYTVAATDYPGMGVDGPSSYLLGFTEANSVLDAARAARELTGASDKLLLWGHSQGGQAALFAAQEVATYAPELHLGGVAVAAPAANLNELMSDDIVDVSGVTIASYAVPAFEAAYADTYPAADMAAILTEAGAAATPTLTDMCLFSQNKEMHEIATPLIGNYVTSDPSTTEPWATMLAENSVGGTKIGVPIFVGQGLADTLVLPKVTVSVVKSMCEAGEDVLFRTFEGVNHGYVAYVALADVMGFFADIAAGKPASSTCPQQ